MERVFPMQKVITATLLVAMTGCAVAQNPAIRIEDHSISTGWQQTQTGAWERVVVVPPPRPQAPVAVVDPNALPYAVRSQSPAAQPVVIKPAQPVVYYAPPRPAVATHYVAPQPQPAAINPPAQRAMPRPAPSVAKAPPAPARATPAPAAAALQPTADLQRRERELTLRYAEGDKDAAVDLAKLLYSQGRVSTGDTVLDFAVRNKHPMALQLKAERQQLQGG